MCIYVNKYQDFKLIRESSVNDIFSEVMRKYTEIEKFREESINKLESEYGSVLRNHIIRVFKYVKKYHGIKGNTIDLSTLYPDYSFIISELDIEEVIIKDGDLEFVGEYMSDVNMSIENYEIYLSDSSLMDLYTLYGTLLESGIIDLIKSLPTSASKKINRDSINEGVIGEDLTNSVISKIEDMKERYKKEREELSNKYKDQVYQKVNKAIRFLIKNNFSVDNEIDFISEFDYTVTFNNCDIYNIYINENDEVILSGEEYDDHGEGVDYVVKLSSLDLESMCQFYKGFLDIGMGDLLKNNNIKAAKKLNM